MKVFAADMAAPKFQRLVERLRELRIDAELTMAEVARRTGIHRPIIGRIERGLHVPSYETLARYAAALELDVATVAVVLNDDWAASAVRVQRELAQCPKPARPPRVSARFGQPSSWQPKELVA